LCLLFLLGLISINNAQENTSPVKVNIGKNLYRYQEWNILNGDTSFTEGIYTDLPHPDPKINEIYSGNLRPCGVVKTYNKQKILIHLSPFDSLSNYHGKVIEMENNGKDTLSIVEYYHGKQNGVEKYFENKHIQRIGYFKDGKENGMRTEYYFYEGCHLCFDETNYVNGKKEGISFAKDSCGKVLEMWTYKNDTLNGEYIQYDKDGRLKQRIMYKNGLYHGDYFYSPTEDWNEYRTYVMGKKNGRCYKLNEKGKLVHEVNYYMGVAHGLQRQYYGDLLILEGNYNMGKQVGKWLNIVTDHNGKKLYKEIQEFNENGELIYKKIVD
jgi:antitoxin component YwqK of YwqJK toxin-antitoxin module